MYHNGVPIRGDTLCVKIITGENTCGAVFEKKYSALDLK